MMWYWGSGAHWWAWGLGIFTMIIFWGLVSWLTVTLVSGLRRGFPGQGDAGPWRGEGPRHADDPEQILGRRFATGEIDADEYHRRLDVLRSRRYAADGERR
jgi:putative membrane protein